MACRCVHRARVELPRAHGPEQSPTSKVHGTKVPHTSDTTLQLYSVAPTPILPLHTGLLPPRCSSTTLLLLCAAARGVHAVKE